MRGAILTGALVLACLAAACPNVVPAFSLKSSEGKTLTEASLVEKPTLLVFFKKGCPANPKASPVLNKLQEEAKGTFQVLGVISASPAEAAAEAKKLGLKIPLLADEAGALTASFKPERSMDFTIVATKKEARWPKLWPGLGSAEIAQGLEVIKAHGHTLAAVTLSPADGPSLRGCRF